MVSQADCAPAPPVILILIVGHRRLMQVGKNRKEYAFWRQFNEKPSVIPGCPEADAGTMPARLPFLT